MALDDKTLGKFVELLNNLSQAFGANLSQLLNVEVSMSFDGLMEQRLPAHNAALLRYLTLK